MPRWLSRTAGPADDVAVICEAGQGGPGMGVPPSSGPKSGLVGDGRRGIFDVERARLQHKVVCLHHAAINYDRHLDRLIAGFGGQQCIRARLDRRSVTAVGQSSLQDEKAACIGQGTIGRGLGLNDGLRNRCPAMIYHSPFDQNGTRAASDEQ